MSAEAWAIFYWCVCGGMCIVEGGLKDRLNDGILLGLLLGPLGLAVIYLMPAGGVLCRFCKREIPIAATCCCYCTRPLNAPQAKIVASNSVRA